MHPLRTKKRPLSEYKALLRIDVDWSSTGIWEIEEPGQRSAGKACAYQDFNLPAWLIDRFNYWTAWHDSHEPWKDTPGLDSQLYNAYALSLAIDLKRLLGDDYYIEYGGREIHDDRQYLEDFHAKQEKR